MKKLAVLCAAASLGLSSFVARADDLPAPPDINSINVPPPNCDRPPLEPRHDTGQGPNNQEIRIWNSKVNSFQNCIKAYVLDLNTKAKAYNEIAIKIQAGANAGNDLYTKWVDESNKARADD